MNTIGIPARRVHAYWSRPRRERGIVLFIALLVMVALSLAGIALIRSADTATVVAGNLAFKQAAASAVDRSIEHAVQALFDPAGKKPDIADKTKHSQEKNYFACVLATDGKTCLSDMPAGTPIPEIPTALATKTAAADLMKAADDTAKIPEDAGGNKSYYVIERMCGNTGPAVGSNCNLSSASLGADAGTQHYEGIVRAGDAFYRVTVRVEGPRNTVEYAQAILQ